VNLAEIERTLQTCPLTVPANRPWLLFDADQVGTIRSRAAAEEGVIDNWASESRRILEGMRPIELHAAGDAGGTLQRLALANFFLQDGEIVERIKSRIHELLAMETWMYPGHGEGGSSNPHADHVMTNVAAVLARVHDLMPEAFSESETDELAARVRDHALVQFCYSCHKREAWWAYADCRINWKIMCCGESGFAACAFADRIPEVRDVIWYGVRGVVEMLDMLPPEGDWDEGLTYWFTTLFMGLRFGLALRTLTGGAVDILAHPRLDRTGDFAVALTTPSGALFNFGDNVTKFRHYDTDALALLAVTKKQPEWLRVARRSPSHTPLWFALDTDEPLPEVNATPLASGFPSSGIAAARSGWTDGDTFVGLKCGRSEVNHGHMDQNTFVVEARGVPLIIEEGFWLYALELGFHDYEKSRWNFDGCATIGHNTMLVDGQGQTYGPDFKGQVHPPTSGEGWFKLTGDAAGVYPDLLNAFVRTILLIGRDTIVVRDVVRCCGERHLEWLMHYGGLVRDVEDATVIDNQGVRLVVTPLSVDYDQGWRVSDVTRRSTYADQQSLSLSPHSIRYRSFASFAPAEEHEFLFVMRVDGDETGGDWTFTPEAGSWNLSVDGSPCEVRPDGDTMTVIEA